jgi:hypothetical protein
MLHLNSIDSLDKNFIHTCQGYFSKNDARLIQHGQRIFLDAIPYGSEYDPVKKTSYSSYSDIKTGNLLYYNQGSVPFLSLLYANPSANVKISFTDPMGTQKTYFEKTQYVSPFQTTPKWLRDTQFHREDIINKQSQKYHQIDFNTNKFCNKQEKI